MEDRLNQEQRAKIQAWFDSKTPLIGACPMCHHREWVLGDQMVQPLAFHQGSIIMGGNAIPLIMLVCGHCANVQFHSAVQIGLFAAAKPEQPDPVDIP